MVDSIDRHVGRKIKRRRRLLGMPLNALAAEVGVSFQQVSKYEQGLTRISVATLFRISQVLDVSVTYFFDELALRGRARTEGEPAPSPDVGR